MPDINDSKSKEPVVDLESIEKFLTSLGHVFSDVELYGLTHGITAKATESCFSVILAMLENVETVSITTADDAFMVNGITIEVRTPLIKSLMKRFSSVGVSSFSIKKGMSSKHFSQLIEILTASPDDIRQLGGFAKVVEIAGLESISVKQVVYKQVTEDERVVSKDKGQVLDESGREKVLSMLGGNIDVSDKDVVENMHSVSHDADKLSDLIVSSAKLVREESSAQGGAGAVLDADVVLDCLRRAHDALMNDPAVKTQKGRKALSKTFKKLEEELLQKMQESMGVVSDFDHKRISEAVESMSDELEIDGLASDYLKKRNAISANERRILRFMKSKGLDGLSDSELKQKLLHGGLDDITWQKLLLKSGVALGAGGGTDPSGNELDVAQHLSSILELLENRLSQGDSKESAENAVEISQMVTGLDNDVADLATQTGKKIDGLVTSVHDDESVVDVIEKEATKAGRGPKLSRKKMLILLAEIAQELCQPLSVINCSLEMIASKNLGEVNDSQVDMLKLATESSDKLRVLIDNLIEISGLPDTMSPDASIQASLYDK